MNNNKCEGCRFVQQEGRHEICTMEGTCENQELTQKEEELITDGDW